MEYQGGGDKSGPTIVKLLTTLKGIQQGNVPDSFGWVELVKPYEAGKDYILEGAVVSGVNGKTPDQLA